MKVLDIKEHEDGSATYQFDLTNEEHDAMCRNGILWAIVSGLTGVSVDQVLEDWKDDDDNA
jgi:hypothetical protein